MELSEDMYVNDNAEFDEYDDEFRERMKEKAMANGTLRDTLLSTYLDMLSLQKNVNEEMNDLADRESLLFGDVSNSDSSSESRANDSSVVMPPSPIPPAVGDNQGRQSAPPSSPLPIIPTVQKAVPLPLVFSTYKRAEQWPVWDETNVRDLNEHFQMDYEASRKLPPAPCSSCHEWYPGQRFILTILSTKCRRCHTEKEDTWHHTLRRRRARTTRTPYNLRRNLSKSNLATIDEDVDENGDEDEVASDDLNYVRPKKFSEENNVKPDEVVPDCLKGLTYLEELLIARTMPHMHTFVIERSGQLGYRGNVITFPQDIDEVAKNLPRSGPLMVCVVKKGRCPGARDKIFRVRRQKIEDALVWLQQNNRFYHDLNIDQNQLSQLPVDGVYEGGIEYVVDNDLPVEDDAEIADDGEIVDGGVMAIPRTTVNNQVQAVSGARRILAGADPNQPMEWPRIDNSKTGAIVEFTHEGLWVMSYPCLYPYGAADFNTPRTISLTLAEYVNHLLLYKDGRFATHGTWRYFALNMVLRWRATKNAKVYIRHKDQDAVSTIDELKAKVAAGDTELLGNMMYYSSTIAGTPAYWHQQKGKMFAMFYELGIPSLFFTLSSADIQWPEFREIILQQFPNDVNLTQQQLVNKHPLTVDRLFAIRVEAFLDTMFGTDGWDVQDYYYKVEYQHRGSPHVHGMVWLKLNPLENAKVPDDEQYVVDYIDLLVCEQLYAVSDPLNAPRKPASILLSDTMDLVEDLKNMVGNVQQHSTCNDGCLRTSERTGEKYCRYGFPKVSQPFTQWAKSADGRVTIRVKRNHPRVNSYNPTWLPIWRANLDVQICRDAYSVIQYMAKYTAKSEVKSQMMDRIINKALSSTTSSTSTLSLVAKLLCAFISERDYSAQEVCHLGTSLPMVHCSRFFVHLNTDPSRELVNLRESAISREEVMCVNSIDKYAGRSRALEDVCMFTYFRDFDVNSTRTTVPPKRPIAAIVTVIPRYSSDRNGVQYEDYCRQQMLLRAPFRSVADCLQNGRYRTYQAAYEEAIEAGTLVPIVTRLTEDDLNIGNDGLNGDNVDVPDDAANSQDRRSAADLRHTARVEEQRIRQQADWMMAIDPQQHANNDAEFDDFLNDPNIDWAADGRRYNDLNELRSFLRNALLNYSAPHHDDDDDDDVPIPAVHPPTGNDEQLLILDAIRHHSQCARSKPLRLLIHGCAGTGKSFLINSIVTSLGLNPDQILKLAPTGCAAFGIHGRTLHSALKIGGRDKSVMARLTGMSLTNLQNEVGSKKYIIVDEISMVGKAMMGRMAQRLQEARPASSEILGDFSIICFGDFYQLTPIADKPLYEPLNTWYEDTLKACGHRAWQTFNNCVTLTQQMRQVNDPMFGQLLDRVRHGVVHKRDWDLLQTRRPAMNPAAVRTEFKTALRVFAFKSDMRLFNDHAIHSVDQPVCQILAKHNKVKAATIESDKFGGLEAKLKLAKGARVMLNCNIWTEVGLVNGARGEVAEIIYEENEGPPSLPLCVTVKLDDYSGPSLVNGTVPFVTRKESIVENNETLTREMFPLTSAFGITIHKSQGMTTEKVHVNIGDREFSHGLTYVALSRARQLKDVLVDNFDFSRYQELNMEESWSGKNPTSRLSQIKSMVDKPSSNLQCSCGYQPRPIRNPTQPTIVQQQPSTALQPTVQLRRMSTADIAQYQRAAKSAKKN